MRRPDSDISTAEYRCRPTAKQPGQVGRPRSDFPPAKPVHGPTIRSNCVGFISASTKFHLNDNFLNIFGLYKYKVNKVSHFVKYVSSMEHFKSSVVPTSGQLLIVAVNHVTSVRGRVFLRCRDDVKPLPTRRQEREWSNNDNLRWFACNNLVGPPSGRQLYRPSRRRIVVWTRAPSARFQTAGQKREWTDKDLLRRPDE